MHNRFAPHELLELHEFITHETVSAQKGSIFGQSLADNDLRNFAQKCMSLRQKRIQDCQAVIGHAGSEVTSGSYGVGQTWSTGYGAGNWGVTGSQGYEASKHNFEAGKQGYESWKQGYETGKQGYDFGKGYESGKQSNEGWKQGNEGWKQGYETGKQGYDFGKSYESGKQGYESGTWSGSNYDFGKKH